MENNNKDTDLNPVDDTQTETEDTSKAVIETPVLGDDETIEEVEAELKKHQ